MLLGLRSYRMGVTSCCEDDFGRPADESDDVVVPQFVRGPFAGRDDALPGRMDASRQRDAQRRDRRARASRAAQSARAAECGEVVAGKSFARQHRHSRADEAQFACAPRREPHGTNVGEEPIRADPPVAAGESGGRSFEVRSSTFSPEGLHFRLIAGAEVDGLGKRERARLGHGEGRRGRGRRVRTSAARQRRGRQRKEHALRAARANRVPQTTPQVGLGPRRRYAGCSARSHRNCPRRRPRA
jgi:hypothetical protein